MALQFIPQIPQFFYIPSGLAGFPNHQQKSKKTECVHAIPCPLPSLQSPSRAFFRHPRPAQVALLMTKLSAVNMCVSQKTYRSATKTLFVSYKGLRCLSRYPTRYPQSSQKKQICKKNIITTVVSFPCHRPTVGFSVLRSI